MNLYLPNAEKIYFSQTKTYFAEIVRAYDVGNYRSSMVMLYSTIVCDLLMKLKELSEVYEDKKAGKILKEIEDSRSRDMRSAWEWQLIDRLHKETQMIDDETYVMIQHIYDLRNFSAHPALNEDYELVSPSSEMVVAYIKQALNQLFVKPSLFARSVVDKMSDDIASKRDMFFTDFDRFCMFLEKVYLSRMTDKMFNQVFKAFWKFSFMKVEGEDFVRNRILNRNVLRAMVGRATEEICVYIKDNQAVFTVAQDDECLKQLCILLARFPQIYSQLSDEVKFQINQYHENGVDVVKWFEFSSMEEHICQLQANRLVVYNSGPMILLHDICCEQGVESLFIDFIINKYAMSASYVGGRAWFDKFIEPYLERFSAEQFVKLIETINSNPQLYEYAGQFNRNTIIVGAAQGVLPEDFNYAKYDKFRFYRKDSEESGDEEVVIADDDLPF